MVCGCDVMAACACEVAASISGVIDVSYGLRRDPHTLCMGIKTTLLERQRLARAEFAHEKE